LPLTETWRVPMPTWPILFAFRTVWLVILLVIVAGLALWFVVRVVVDSIEWFRDEIVPDLRRRKKNSKEPSEAGKREEDKEDR
jgi:hypothetical protein